MRIKKPFTIFFIVLYSGLIGKYIVNIQENKIHKQQVELKNLEEDLKILEQIYNQKIYYFISEKNKEN